MNIRIIRTHGNRTRTQGKLYEALGGMFVTSNASIIQNFNPTPPQP